MKKAISALCLFVAALVGTYVPAQEKYEPITVKGAEINNGVVIVTVQNASARLELQCNTNVSDCSTIKPGTYVMVRLPKNWGTYQCANVDVYRTPVNHENLAEKLGEYCLVVK
jgi:hypothetical protein